MGFRMATQRRLKLKRAAKKKGQSVNDYLDELVGKHLDSLDLDAISNQQELPMTG